MRLSKAIEKMERLLENRPLCPHCNEGRMLPIAADLRCPGFDQVKNKFDNNWECAVCYQCEKCYRMWATAKERL